MSLAKTSIAMYKVTFHAIIDRRLLYNFAGTWRETGAKQREKKEKKRERERGKGLAEREARLEFNSVLIQRVRERRCVSTRE